MYKRDLFTLTTSDQVKLWGVKSSASDAKAVVVIIHGFAEHLGRYEILTEKLLKSNFNVYRYDNRGHGKSGGKIGHLNDFNDFVTDTDLVVEKATQENPDLPIFMLGHSMGGFIAFLYGLKHGYKLRGQVLSGAATDYNPEIKGMKGTLIKVANKIYPDFMIKNDLSEMISRDREIVRSYQSDPLVFDKATAGFYYQFLIAGTKYLVDRRKDYTCPCLILHGENDKIIEKKVSEKLFEIIASDDKTLKIYEGLYHEILNEPEKELVFGDILEWIEVRC
ncbi:MAG: lysophospholipase [Eubacteriales bacterium]|nr:lysophospholipase [Eubacteriales bacterium]